MVTATSSGRTPGYRASNQVASRVRKSDWLKELAFPVAVKVVLTVGL